MVRVFCTVSLALAAASAVSGHVIRLRQHKAPSGWETAILQDYGDYHSRYIQWDCQNQHNTTFFDTCCHPLLKGESMSVLENLGCNAGCDDGNSSVPPSSTPSSASQPAQAASSPASPSPSSKPASGALADGNAPSPSSSPSSKPASGALAHGDNSPSPSPSPSPTTTTVAPPKPTPAQNSGNGGGGGDVHEGGQGTFFFQNGVAGACGTVHQDSDLICAIDSALFSQSICGKSVLLTNTANGKSVTVIVADECPTCANANSVDLSTGAFTKIGDEGTGVLPIKWEFV